MVEAQYPTHIQWLKTIFMEKLVFNSGPPLANSYAKLIDFSCGGGDLGVELRICGYMKQNIYAVESSTEMINEAKNKRCYNHIA